ncbi:unnamed protein product [marine sediment metagenome]|uniref:NADP-dependent oxidoreductase domain-containing protein n=1 Tax=marine sediment metagenome TaxID=412755 RepID=X1HRH6_9ZZZZ
MDNIENKQVTRRRFMRDTAIATTGLGSVFVSARAAADLAAPQTPQKPKLPQVPRRKLGKTRIKVPCLGLGTMFNLLDAQIVLRNTLSWGVKYWDTANSYAGGNSELGIGKYLSKNPEARKDLFLVTKASGARTVKDVEKRLQTSLKRMHTKYINLYYAPHGMSNPAQLTDELRQWAKDAKKRGLIRFFGIFCGYGRLVILAIALLKFCVCNAAQANLLTASATSLAIGRCCGQRASASV